MLSCFLQCVSSFRHCKVLADICREKFSNDLQINCLSADTTEVCLGYKSILYWPAPSCVKQDASPLSHLMMRMTEFVRRATALISWDEVAGDVVTVQQCSWQNQVFFILHCQSWVEGWGYWGMEVWGGNQPRSDKWEPWRSPGRSQPGLSIMQWHCPRLFCFQSTKNFISVILLSLLGRFIADLASGLMSLGSIVVHFRFSDTLSSLWRAAYSCLVKALLAPRSKF